MADHLPPVEVPCTCPFPECEEGELWGLVWCARCNAHHPPHMPHSVDRSSGTACPKIWGSHGCCLAYEHEGECLCVCGGFAAGRAVIDLCDCGQPYRFPDCHVWR